MMNIFGLNKWFYNIEQILELNEFCQVITLNTEILGMINKHIISKNIVKDSIFTIDSQILYWVVKIRRPKYKIDKLSGSELLPEICRNAAYRNESVFIFGGTESQNKLAIKNLRNMYNVKIDGCYYQLPVNKDELIIINKKILDQIKSNNTKYLFVALSPPKQEIWINENKEKLTEMNVRVAMGCGGAVSIAAGIEKRAPKLIQNLGFEWLYRLWQNPARIKRLINHIGYIKYFFK